MIATEGKMDAEASMFALGTPLVRNRWRIARWTLAGTLIAGLLVFERPALYLASASFYPQGSESLRPGLLSSLGQFGINLPSGTPSQSSEFYQVLLRSRVLFEAVARDTLIVEERAGARVPFLDFFEIEGSESARIDHAVELLSGIVATPTPPRNTSLVLLTAATEWPSVSLFIVEALLDGLNTFNKNVVQGQAGAERTFVEERLRIATGALRDAEDDLEGFLQNNRQYDGSPELVFQADRLQRSIALQQEVYTTLTQRLEEVRVREVRDNPVISMVDQPFVPSLPEPRGRGVFVALGFLTGGFLGSLLGLLSDVMRRLRLEKDEEMEEFSQALREVRHELSAPFRMLRSLFR
jgi:uncharacterized protein involved in exopolysaccharide biosynthesis